MTATRIEGSQPGGSGNRGDDETETKRKTELLVAADLVVLTMECVSSEFVSLDKG